MGHSRKFVLVLIDICIYTVIYSCTILMSALMGDATPDHFVRYIFNALVFLFIIMIFRLFARVYTNVWRYANSRAYIQIVVADAVGGIVATVLTRIEPNILYIGIWQSVSVAAIFNVATLLSRFVYQQRYRQVHVNAGEINKIGVAIVGAGQSGALLAEELLYNSSSHYRPLFFIDISPDKIGSRVGGLKVYPQNDDIIPFLKTMPIQEIFIALPSINGETAKQLHDFYSQSGCKVKMYESPMKEATQDGIKDKPILREIKIEDLLFRNSIRINDARTKEFYSGKTIMITGGGGSIGSEICRQIAKRSPKQLIIFDIYENNAYEIQQELVRIYGTTLDLIVEIGSVRDKPRLEAVFDKYRPDIVFHAAAHKHVPLMEHSSGEAIKNNVFGTYNCAELAEKYAVDRFVLISTDKAVNPTNIMGASKRMCEMIVLCRRQSATSFAAVRFGNVLGSNGSVIPLFKKQIQNGGPLTITDKRIIRYFMTIPEASQLVMQAGAMAGNGELYVLDMGKPVKILELAESMIRLSGYRPYEDIGIIEIGLRPGEKLYEELLIKTEGLGHTDNELIFVENDAPLTRTEVEKKLAVLRRALADADEEIESNIIKKAMKEVVTTYKDPDEVNEKAEQAVEMQLVTTLNNKNQGKK